MLISTLLDPKCIQSLSFFSTSKTGFGDLCTMRDVHVHSWLLVCLCFMIGIFVLLLFFLSCLVCGYVVIGLHPFSCIVSGFPYALTEVNYSQDSDDSNVEAVSWSHFSAIYSSNVSVQLWWNYYETSFPWQSITPISNTKVFVFAGTIPKCRVRVYCDNRVCVRVCVFAMMYGCARCDVSAAPFPVTCWDFTHSLIKWKFRWEPCALPGDCSKKKKWNFGCAVGGVVVEHELIGSTY